ncbi:MAG: hypothetical protein D6785_04205 [Planctomycetota bacterium]|nr:MAG: hypothetical protein D6785_04205 [Planctomycetota bacterium]
MSWSCKNTKEYLEKRLLGLEEVVEDEMAFQSHLSSCSHCQEELNENKSIEYGLQKGLGNIVQTLESPKIQVLMALEEEEKNESPRFQKPWRLAFWMILLMVLLLLPMAYLSLKIATKMVTEKKKSVYKAFHDLEGLAKQVPDIVDHYVQKNSAFPLTLSLSMTQDPWGKPYYLRNLHNERFLLYSFGPNGVDEKGKQDDIWIMLCKRGNIYVIEASSFPRPKN